MAFSEKMKHAPNLVLVIIRSGLEDSFSGEIYHPYQREAVSFCDVNGMLLYMDEFFDAIGYPQAQMKARVFKGTEEKKDQSKYEDVRYVPDELMEKAMNKQSFMIQVKSRENMSWQGDIYWCQKDCTVSFNSELELVDRILKAIN